ncbi:MAG: hypothetical protein JST52_07650 [Bacteroidetes bacterium]|nr:hypothetical protein [Bacteroidota bacterium]MBS1740844.1 hypothetical protein [Bacteroidota bacterium]
MRYLFVFLFLPFLSTAQSAKWLNENQTYQNALQEYVKQHPESVFIENGEKYIFYRQEPYLEGLPKNLDDLHLISINTDSAIKSLVDILPQKRNRLTILHIQKLFARAVEYYIYIYPMKSLWNGKKQTLGFATYTDLVCKVVFASKLEAEGLKYSFQSCQCSKKE